MYKVRAEDASSVEQVDGEVRTRPLFTTNELVLLYFEMEPGGMIDWHTHVPDMDEISMGLEDSTEGDDWPMALWIDRLRDEVVAKDEDAVSE